MINGKKGDGIVPAADTSKNSGIPARVWAALIAVCVTLPRGPTIRTRIRLSVTSQRA